MRTSPRGEDINRREGGYDHDREVAIVGAMGTTRLANMGEPDRFVITVRAAEALKSST